MSSTSIMIELFKLGLLEEELIIIDPKGELIRTESKWNKEQKYEINNS